MFVNIKDDSFPLLEVTFGHSPQSYEDLDIFFGNLDHQYRKKSFCIILDTRKCNIYKYYIYVNKYKIKIRYTLPKSNYRHPRK